MEPDEGNQCYLPVCHGFVLLELLARVIYHL